MNDQDANLARYSAAKFGGIYRNPRHGNGFCEVCTTPIDAMYTLCFACNDAQQSTWACDLADQVLPMVMVVKDSHSGSLMHKYKEPIVTAPLHGDNSPFEQIQLLVLMWMHFHRACIESEFGEIAAITFVPSSGNPPRLALRDISQQLSNRLGIPWLEVRANPNGEKKRGAINPNLYSIPTPIPEQHTSHILIIEDSWVTGARAQSLATALKHAGATNVTVLTIARFLDPATWTPSHTFVSSVRDETFNITHCALGQH